MSTTEVARKKGRKVIWTDSRLKFLFEELMERFGTVDSWGGRCTPVERKDYIDFCESISKIVGAKSEEAVMAQIGWVVTTQRLILKNQLVTFKRNKRIAREVGLIGGLPEDFSDAIKVNYSKA